MIGKGVFLIFVFSLFSTKSYGNDIWNQNHLDQFFYEFVIQNKWHKIILISCQENELISVARKFGKHFFLHLIYVEHLTPQFLKSHTNPKIPLVVLPSCSYSNHFLEMAGNTKGFTRQNKWWIIKYAKMKDSIGIPLNESESFLKYLRLDSEMRIIVLNIFSLSTLSANIWDVFKSGYKQEIKYILLASWSIKIGENLVMKNLSLPQSFKIKNILNTRAESLKGKTLRIAVLNNLEYDYDCYIGTNLNGQIQLSGGYSQAILSELQNIFGFKVQILETSTWGTAVDLHNTWSGLIGAIVSHRADIALCHPTITSERAKVVSFLHPTLIASRVLIYRGADLPVSRDVFVMTFTGPLWMSTLWCLIVVAIAIWVTAKLDPDPAQRPWSKWEAVLWAVSAICQQGFNKSPNSLACMCVFATGYLTTYLLYTCFACGVTSLLAAQAQPVYLQPREATHLHLRFAVYWPGLQYQYFQTSTDSLEKRLWSTELRKERNRLRSIQHLIATIRSDNCVAMASEHVIHQYLSSKLTAEDACQLTIAPVVGTRHVKAFAVRIDSQEKLFFNYWLLRLQETGILALHRTRRISRAPSCGNGPGYSSAGIDHVMSAMVILASGIAIAILCLSVERAWFQHKNETHWEYKSKKEISKRLKKNMDKNQII